MGRVLGLLTLLVLGAIALAVVAPSLAPGNPLREAGEILREIGQSISRGFGGGYGELLQGN